MDYVNQIKDAGSFVTQEAFLRLCRVVLEDRQFAEAPASAGHHPGPHQERGGLALHTLEVIQEAVRMAGGTGHLAELAYVAGVFHDYGKIHDYAWGPDGKVIKTEFQKRTGHLVWSWWFFLNIAPNYINTTDIDEIAHAMLAHHGRREWGSPVEPQTRLAYILHTADMISSRGAK